LTPCRVVIIIRTREADKRKAAVRMAAKLMTKWDVTMVRNHVNGKGAKPVDVYGEIEKVTATGRATCRCCGQKIVKGDEALQFMMDLVGSGSWTATTAYLHLNCEAAR
jgi:hypothetical protein